MAEDIIPIPEWTTIPGWDRRTPNDGLDMNKQGEALANRIELVKSRTDAMVLPFATQLDAVNALSGLAEGQRVEVESDETRSNRRTRYEVNDGALVYQGLAADAGSTSFIQAGSGAVDSTVWDKLREYVSFTDYTGFLGDGINDDKAAVEAAAAYCISSGKGLYCPPGYKVKLSGSVNLKGIRNVCIESDIVISSGMLTVGGNVNAGKFNITLQAVTNGTSLTAAAPPTTPVVRVIGVSNSEVSIGSCNYIQLYADAGASGDRFVAYNQFRLTGTVSLLELTDSGVALSYVNENAIYADRVVRYRVIGVGYAHNHNKLFHPCMEGVNAEILFSGNGVSVNQVYGARFEAASASPGVTFGAGTYSNTVISTWSGVGNPRNQFIAPVPVSDSGQGNMVTTESAHLFRKTPLFYVGSGSVIVGTSTDCVADDARIAPSNPGLDNFTPRVILTPGIAGVTPNGTGRYLAISDIIPVRLGDVIVWDADFDGSIARTSVFVYDENMNPLLNEGTGGPFVSKASYSFNSTYGRYAEGANISAAGLLGAPCAITRSEVKFVRVAFYLGVIGMVRGFSASIFTQAIGRGVSENSSAVRSVMRVLDGAPTRGYAPLNYAVFDKTAKVMRWVSYTWETRVSGALASGATTVAVTAVGAIANGDIVGILLDDKTTHWTTVSALSGSTFTIAAIPASRSVLDGARIVFNRWAS